MDEAFSGRALFEILSPFLSRESGKTLPPDAIERASESFESARDFEVSSQKLAEESRALGFPPAIEELFAAIDRITKQGSVLRFMLRAPFRYKPPKSSVAIEADKDFEIEIRSGRRPFGDSQVTARKQDMMAALPNEIAALPPGQLLFAAILPQRKTLLGVSTPITVRALGFPFSLRFLAAALHDRKPRLFAAGPVVQEIALNFN